MSMVVYWLQVEEEGKRACFKEFGDEDLGAAMALVSELRSTGQLNVCVSSEPAAMVGKMGVEAVAGGKLPSGEQYDWSKAHRAGATRRRGR